MLTAERFIDWCLETAGPTDQVTTRDSGQIRIATFTPLACDVEMALRSAPRAATGSDRKRYSSWTNPDHRIWSQQILSSFVLRYACCSMTKSPSGRLARKR